MIIPRRVRRRLLLPPGWVALGLLLLLGCRALQPWQHQLKLWNVIKLTMPPLRGNASYMHFLEQHPLHKLKEEYNPYTTAWSPNAAAMLRKMRPWHDIEFGGNDFPDFLSANATESAIRQIIADTSHAGGVRVRFLPGTTYTNLVKVLDIMKYTGQKKYWLDIRHQPTTLYAITAKPTQVPLTFSCGTRYAEAYLPPPKIGFRELMTEFWEKSLVLLSRPWQVIALWLAIISSLSLWRLVQPKLGRSDV
jgi:hypothetical protein